MTRLWTWESRRMRIAILCLLALTIEGLMRSNINMAMVCMLKHSALVSAAAAKNFTLVENSDCPILDITMGSVRRPPPGTLDWNSQQRGFIFTSFYFGGLFACFFIEVLSRVIGAKKVILYGAIINVIGTFITPPVAANFHLWFLLAVRFIMGFGQGLLWPCMNVLVTHWFPANEKSTALAITTTGNQLSVIIAMFATAELCQLPFGGGWPMAFHAYGIAGVALCVLWHLYVTDSPSETPDISESEIEVIHGGFNGKVKPVPVSWRKLLASPLIWSIAASSFAHNYITVGTVSYLPTYYKTVLNMSISTNGVLSAIPFVFQLISKFIYAGFADGFKKKGCLSFTTITKVCNTSASFGLAFCFALLCLADCSQRLWAVTLVCLAMAFVSGYVPGYNTSIVVISPGQTAAVAAFSRVWGQIAATLSPFQIGYTTGHGTLAEWRVIFLSITVMCVISGAAFQIWGSADEQEWSRPQEPQLMPPEERAEEARAEETNLEKP